MGFPVRARRANLRDARWKIALRFARRQDRNTPQKHVWRAEIVLLTADGVGTNEIMRRTGKSKICVWRWQERFIDEGFNGLLHDKTRPPRIKPLGARACETGPRDSFPPAAEIANAVLSVSRSATNLNSRSVRTVMPPRSRHSE